MQDSANAHWIKGFYNQDDNDPVSGTQDDSAHRRRLEQLRPDHHVYGTQDWRPHRAPSPPRQPEPVLTPAQREAQMQEWRNAAAAHDRRKAEEDRQRREVANAVCASAWANRPVVSSKPKFLQDLREKNRIRKALKPHNALLDGQQRVDQHTVLQMGDRFNSMRMVSRPQATLSSSNQRPQSGAAGSRAASPAFKPTPGGSTRRF